jgi:UDP-N-acetylmuramoyl-tripeptide--D-alanyl-D-alanine ligase
MVAALSTLSVEPARRRIAVLGEMWELGSAAAEYHREVGRAVGEKGIDLLIAVGRYAAEMAAGAAEAGLDASGIRSCESVEQAAQVLRSELADRDVVLVKASRAARLEDLIRRVER